LAGIPGDSQVLHLPEQLLEVEQLPFFSGRNIVPRFVDRDQY
jgi:hypothetical protein